MIKAILGMVFTLIQAASALVANYCAPVFILKLIYDVFVGGVPFWSGLFLNTMTCVLVFFISIVVFFASRHILSEID